MGAGRDGTGSRPRASGLAVLFVGSLALFHLMTGNSPLAGGEEGIQQNVGALWSVVAYGLVRAIIGGHATGRRLPLWLRHQLCGPGDGVLAVRRGKRHIRLPRWPDG